ncbi:hypothetical protein PL9631_490093 [Planktothrix paucivesiculata PCC 9631]|uniref:Uncharacterized protein n=1 Tax=Planktothrix paucivesiculata PCC 9631 TaxID=671071 RepID=A0A7Z9BSZ0_9CYAN|nr:hypothetical protein PL9631_490093 [Planktothrix paucivesiculata PCC 9631]
MVVFLFCEIQCGTYRSPKPPRQLKLLITPLPALSGLTHKTKETGFLAGDFADEIWISGSETQFGA